MALTAACMSTSSFNINMSNNAGTASAMRSWRRTSGGEGFRGAGAGIDMDNPHWSSSNFRMRYVVRDVEKRI